MTQAYLVLAVIAAGSVAYLVREYKPTFLVSAALTWLFAIMQWFLGNIGCQWYGSAIFNNLLDHAVFYAVPAAVVVGASALLFAYALKLHGART